jgi:hypothetical protein
VVAKRNVLKSQLPLSLLVLAATAVLLTIIYFVYRGFLPHSKCESIFEQTTDQLRGNLDVVKMNGDLVLGREKVQDLTESSQKVALHLKTCCIALEAGAMNADQFQVCISGAKDYETKFVQVATNIKEVKAAEEQQKPEIAKQKTEQSKEAANEAISTEKELDKQLQKMLIEISASLKELAARSPASGQDTMNLLLVLELLKQQSHSPPPPPPRPLRVAPTPSPSQANSHDK